MNWKRWLILAGCLLIAMTPVQAEDFKIDPEKKARIKPRDPKLGFRSSCENATAQITQEINNIRAVLTTGGDVWWNGDRGIYVAPKVAPGEPEVSSIFAGAVWLGGIDDGFNFKVACQAGGRAVGNFDFYPGPLDPLTGNTDRDTCRNWDRFFRVTADEIDEHLRLYQEAIENDAEYDTDLMPVGVKGWPARGNRFFESVWRFPLPNTSQGLAGFFDRNGNDLYEPDQGDFPIIEIRGCPDPQYPDEMIFWIYNDAGNVHNETNGDPIRMEVQVQAFSYATNDVINNMTFQRYKLINRAVEPIDSTFFAMWVDPDLGCFEDDYIGSDTSRSLGYVYNADAVDGISGCACGEVNTYCTDIPLLGVDYFRGPLNEFGEELGMSSFTYFNNGGFGNPPPGTTDPDNFIEYYNYLSGSWKDGSPFTFGDDAYQDGDPIKYAFVSPPDAPQPAWSMCNENLPEYDRRFIQASGPFRLDPGAVNELIIGVVWVADVQYPCPSIRKLQAADDIAQALFDNCFDIPEGPDAPDVDWIELDREIIGVLSNSFPSNNVGESYEEKGLNIPQGISDSLYRFEGYRVFQFSDPNVSLEDRDDPSKVREVLNVDLRNGIGTIFNWVAAEETPTDEVFYVPQKQVDGRDEGIRNTFRITTDAFADGDAKLINHRPYFFTVVAYGYNEYEEYDPTTLAGQREPYLEGRRNIGEEGLPFYTVVPRPVVDRRLQAEYGDGAIVTRLDGRGTGTNFLDLSEGSRQAIEAGEFNGVITYAEGQGPINVEIYNPLEVVDGSFELTLFDDDMGNEELDPPVRWQLRNLDDPEAEVIISENPIEESREQLIREYGFSILLGQVDPPGGRAADPTNGFLGYEEEYEDPSQAWVAGVPDGFDLLAGTPADDEVFHYMLTRVNERDELLDPFRAFTELDGQPQIITPYYLSDFDVRDPGFFYISPAWSNPAGSRIVRQRTELADLNNVDIVLTADKSLWSRCVIVEGANRFYKDPQFGFPTEGDRDHFDLRARPSVGKEDLDGDGLPDPDKAVDENGNPVEGMGWFPGYAVDVETGQRLNIFFAENSFYDCGVLQANGLGVLCDFLDGGGTGADMLFNPSRQLFMETGIATLSPANFMVGGQHTLYVTKTPYDEGQALYRALRNRGNPLVKVSPLTQITWTGMLFPINEGGMRSLEEGLIPGDVVLKLRVEQPYAVATGTGEFNGYPTYRFQITEKAPLALGPEEVADALDLIKVVPNPYYGFSEYEPSAFDPRVKITNLPARCVVTIYTLEGKFVRQYRRNEQPLPPRGDGVNAQQIVPDLEWDLRNAKGIPVASGIYLIQVAAEGLGERTLKWFGIKRPFDPSAN